jgi:predicted aspartyl protease
VSATPKAPVWTGYFSKSGSPALKVTVKGPFGQGVEFEGILDTGFTGFISMPLLSALPLGLILYGTVSVELADGSKSVKLTARGIAVMEGESEVGVVVLEPNSSEVLIGMAFLRLFKRALLLSQNKVYLVDESQTPETAEPPVEPANPEELSPASEPENPGP